MLLGLFQVDLQLVVSSGRILVPTLSTTRLINSRLFWVIICSQNTIQLQLMFKEKAKSLPALRRILLQSKGCPKKRSCFAEKSGIRSASYSEKPKHSKPTGKSLILLQPDVSVTCL